MQFKGNKLENCAEMIKGLTGKSIPLKRIGHGSDILSLYQKKDYSEIKRHLESDLLLTRAIDLTFRRYFETLAPMELVSAYTALQKVLNSLKDVEGDLSNNCFVKG